MNYYSFPEVVTVQLPVGSYMMKFNVECIADMRKEDVGAGPLEFWGAPVRHSMIRWEVDRIHIKSIEWFSAWYGANQTRYELTGDKFREWSPGTYERILSALYDKLEAGKIEFEAEDEW